MSLSNKLYEIGKTITDKSLIESLIRRFPDNAKDYETVTINFEIKKNKIINLDISKKTVENSFFSEKLGGSGSAIFYIYPALIVHDEKLIDASKKPPKGKFVQLKNTLENIINQGYANKPHESVLKLIFDSLESTNIIEKLKNYSKGNYLYSVTLNGKSLYESMPEIWDNWFERPARVYTNLDTKQFYDATDGESSEIGYNPEIGCYTVNNYNDKLKHRIIDNLPLSQKSAKYIKFGWLYAKNHLLFYFDGMQYLILPSFAKENHDELLEVLNKLRIANENSVSNRDSIRAIANEEAQLQKEIKKLENLKKRDQETILKKNDDLKELQNTKSTLEEKVATGLFTDFGNEIHDLESIYGVTLDFIFMQINKSEVKIYGSLEEVLPSKVLSLVKAMKRYNIDDTLKIKDKDYTQTYLHDYFHRNELYFHILNSKRNDPKDIVYRPKILEERFFLAKLLLGGGTISRHELYKRFEFHSMFNYDHTKRLDQEQCHVWLSQNNGYELYQHENQMLSFLKDEHINKLKED